MPFGIQPPNKINKSTLEILYFSSKIFEVNFSISRFAKKSTNTFKSSFIAKSFARFSFIYNSLPYHNYLLLL